MPISVAIKYTWKERLVLANWSRQGKSGSISVTVGNIWRSGAEKWTMWDVALLQAFLKPEQASEIAVLTPPENTQRMVWLYDDIDSEAMETDFWKRLTEEEKE